MNAIVRLVEKKRRRQVWSLQVANLDLVTDYQYSMSTRLPKLYSWELRSLEELPRASASSALLRSFVCQPQSCLIKPSSPCLHYIYLDCPAMALI